MSGPEIRRLAVTDIREEKKYNKGVPVPHSINDLKMGTNDRRFRCGTCINSPQDCPGHFGKLELPVPIYNIGQVSNTCSVLRLICPFCCRLAFTEEEISGISSVSILSSRTKSACSRCASPLPKYTSKGPDIFWDWTPQAAAYIADIGLWPSYGRPFNAADALSILENVPDEDFDRICVTRPTDAILTVILVPPPAIRPAISSDAKVRSEDDLTFVLELCIKAVSDTRVALEQLSLKKTLTACSTFQLDMQALRQKRKQPEHTTKRKRGTKNKEDVAQERNEAALELESKKQRAVKIKEEISNDILLKGVVNLDTTLTPYRIHYNTMAVFIATYPKIYEKLQRTIASVSDNRGKVVPAIVQRSGSKVNTITERINTKYGRVRGHLMGKRVDFTARSVIGPGPEQDVDQLGVPIEVARILTVPIRVTYANINEMTELVRIGAVPDSLFGCGANRILYPDRRVVFLEYQDKQSRAAIKLVVGCWVERHLKNDDIVLFNRQPSLHRPSIMAFRTLLINKRSFQVNLAATKPFNADFDGDEMNLHVLQSEPAAAEAANMMNIQECIISPQTNAPIISLVQNTLVGLYLLTDQRRSFTPNQANSCQSQLKYSEKLTLKKDYTGRDIFSFLLPKNMSMKVRTGAGDDGAVFVERGQLISGRICKRSVGTSSNGIVDVMVRDIGERETMQFLSDAQRLATWFINLVGFSLGISDTWTNKETTTVICNTLNEVSIIENVWNRALGMKITCEERRGLEEKTVHILSQISDKASKFAIDEFSEQNNNSLLTMIRSGAKGKHVNIGMVTACVGQQIIDGRRPKRDRDGRTIPCYNKNDVRAEVCGFVRGNYRDGLTPAETFMHYMGGREGLVDTAVKTSRSGYMQRQLIKATENLVVAYDYTVRCEGKAVVEFLYGGDGMDATKIEKTVLPKLTPKKLLELSMGHTEWSLKLSELWEKISICNASRILTTDETQNTYVAVNVARLLHNRLPATRHGKNIVTVGVDINTAYCLVKDTSDWIYRRLLRPHDTNAAVYQQYILWHTLSPLNLTQNNVDEKELRDMLDYVRVRFDKSIVSPGEMAGIVSSQSVGEPSTQMTLNTFHLAGHGNVTLSTGVPRFSEIITMVPVPATPYMSLRLKHEFCDKESANIISKRLVCVTLASLIDNYYRATDPPSKNKPHTVIAAHEDMMCGSAEIYGPEPESYDGIPLSYDILCFVLKRKLMQEHGIVPYDVARSIYEYHCKNNGTPLTLIYSQSLDDTWFIRLRMSAIDASTHHMIMDMNKNIKLCGLPGIDMAIPRQCVATEKEKDEWAIETSGSAFLLAANIEEIDWYQSYSNNVTEICEVLGIDAAKHLIYSELQKVVSFEEAYVDKRHLMLLANALTFRGMCMATSRHGQNRVDTGLLMRCSFEETTDLLLGAAYSKERDDLRGLTQAIMLGNLAPIGTGTFGIQSTTPYSALRTQKNDLCIPTPKPDRVDTSTGLAFSQQHKRSRQEYEYCEEILHEKTIEKTLDNEIFEDEYIVCTVAEPTVDAVRGFRPSSPSDMIFEYDI